MTRARWIKGSAFHAISHRHKTLFRNKKREHYAKLVAINRSMTAQYQQHQDTYFFNSEAALRHASALRTENQGYWMQCCYYDGEKLSTNLPNLFHQPFETLTSDLAEGSHRIPTAVSFENTNFPRLEIEQLHRSFRSTVAQAKVFREEFNRLYLKALANVNLDFN